MPSLSPDLSGALSDQYGGQWRVEYALQSLSGVGNPADAAMTNRVTTTRDVLAAAMRIAPRDWYGKRLPVLWTTFMASRPADGRALAVWMMEAARLLADLPHDIAGFSIDDAVRTARHNFMPSIGEIRAIATPLVEERQRQIRRLDAISDALRSSCADTSI